MIKIRHTIKDAKNFIDDNCGKPISFRYKEMRKVMGDYHGTITKSYPMVFVIHSDELSNKTSMTFSYPDLIMRKVEIIPSKDDSNKKTTFS